MSLRAIKARARSALHEHMRVRALYIPADGSTPVPCNVRVHTKFTQLGDQKGTSFASAETEEQAPRLVFYGPEITPIRGSKVTINAVEGYAIGATLPPDDMQFIHARVALLSAAQMAGLPLPPSDASEYPAPSPVWEETEW